MSNFRIKPRFPEFTAQFLLSGRFPSEPAMKARACVRHDRRCAEIQRRREAV